MNVGPSASRISPAHAKELASLNPDALLAGSFVLKR